MTTISLVSMHPVAGAKSGEQSLWLVAMMCGCGLAASISALAFGVDLSAAWL